MGEEVHGATRAAPRLVEGLSEGFEALDILPRLFPGPSSSPFGPRRGELESRQEKA